MPTHARLTLAVAALLVLGGATLGSAAAQGPRSAALPFADPSAMVPFPAAAFPAAVPSHGHPGAGGCGERTIRVYDAAAGEVRERTARVCWRTLL